LSLLKCEVKSQIVFFFFLVQSKYHLTPTRPFSLLLSED